MRKKYFYGVYRKEISSLLRERLKLRDRVRFHKKKIEYHQGKIEDVEVVILPALELELDKYLKKAKSVSEKLIKRD